MIFMKAKHWAWLVNLVLVKPPLVGRSFACTTQPAARFLYNGNDIAKLKNGSKQMLAFRRATQMIFQDPYASLNPRMKVKDIIAEGIDIHHLAKNNADRDHQVEQLLEEVGF